jgi:putative transposase
LPGKDNQHGILRLTGVGHLKLRGMPRTPGEPKTLEICHKAGQWYASVTMSCEPVRQGGTLAAGLDVGIETFATLSLAEDARMVPPPAGVVVRQEGTTLAIASLKLRPARLAPGTPAQQAAVPPGRPGLVIENPRHTRQALQKLKRAQRALARKQKGSANRAKARRQVTRLHQKVAARRLNFLHQVTAWLAMWLAFLATEQLNIQAMTAQGGRRKRGLNREWLSVSPGTFLAMLKTKVEETALQYVEVPTRTVKPSQTCSVCGRQAKKSLDERIHACPCGLRCGRDENAARVMLNWALSACGREPAACGVGSSGASSGRVKLPAKKHETPAIPAFAG